MGSRGTGILYLNFRVVIAIIHANDCVYIFLPVEEAMTRTRIVLSAMNSFRLRQIDFFSYEVLRLAVLYASSYRGRLDLRLNPLRHGPRSRTSRNILFTVLLSAVFVVSMSRSWPSRQVCLQEARLKKGTAASTWSRSCIAQYSLFSASNS